MKKFILLVIACVILLSFSSVLAEKDLSDIKIAYVSSELSNEIFAMQVEALKKYCEDKGITFYNTPCTTVEEKISATENYTNMGVDAIIVHVSDPEAMIDSMKAAQEAGIKYFAYDTPVEGADCFYGWDNYQYGEAIGQNAVDWIKKTFAEDEPVYAASANYPEFNFLVIRESGYKDLLSKECPNVEWVAEGVGGTAPNGVIAGENFLQTGYDINLVVGINDGGCLGVLEAFNAANYGNDKVGIFAGDATNDALVAIDGGTIFRGTVTTGLIALAPEFIDICVGMINGDEAAFGEHFGPTTLITKENVKDFIKN